LTLFWCDIGATNYEIPFGFVGGPGVNVNESGMEPKKNRTLFFFTTIRCYTVRFTTISLGDGKPDKPRNTRTTRTIPSFAPESCPRSRFWRISRSNLPIPGLSPIFNCQRTISLTLLLSHIMWGYSSSFLSGLHYIKTKV